MQHTPDPKMVQLGNRIKILLTHGFIITDIFQNIDCEHYIVTLYNFVTNLEIEVTNEGDITFIPSDHADVAVLKNITNLMD